MAAAVSDFYVPWASLPEHKIQSSTGSLELNLQTVPKCLPLLTQEWAPQAFHVSFKLETDKDILIKKAQAAIAKNGVHCVVANMLETRKEECVTTSTPHQHACWRCMMRLQIESLDNGMACCGH